MRVRRMLSIWSPALVAVLATSACTSAAATGTSAAAPVRLPVVALPGYEVTKFTAADSRLIVANPDSVVVDGNHVFIDYQNTTAKDCTDTNSSTVIEYDMRGKILGHWTVAGHSDGMRVDPAAHLIWTTSCEDGNPKFATIDATSGTVTPYTFPSPPHGGGYDDLFFLDGSVFVAASNPTLDASGNNPNPAIDKIAIGANGQLTLTPVLDGYANATDWCSCPARARESRCAKRAQKESGTPLRAPLSGQGPKSGRSLVSSSRGPASRRAG
jgi:hypothetical protein